jgi:hypothetical protein
MRHISKFVLTTVFGTALVVSALSQDQFPDVPVSHWFPDIPANHWAYMDLLQARMLAHLPLPPGRFSSGPPASRLKFAMDVHEAWAHIKTLQDRDKSEIVSVTKQIANSAKGTDLKALRSRLGDLQAQVLLIRTKGIPLLDRLIDGFEGDLAKVNFDARRMKVQLVDPFADVPASHWASEDLLELKANGIFVGYPDGLFRGR